MKYLFGLTFILWINIVFAQVPPSITLNKKQMTIKNFLEEIKKQTGFSIVHVENLFDQTSSIDLNIKNKPLDRTLNEALASKGIQYEIRNKTIVLTRSHNKNDPRGFQEKQEKIFTGTIKDNQGRPIAGATISLNKTNTILAVSDKNGKFEIELSDHIKALYIAHMSFENQELVLDPNIGNYEISLTEKIDSLEEAVVTGIYTRDKESFTGSSSTFTQKELKMVGNSNVLSALRTLDPSFAINEDVQFGSDPNRLPDINIRGKTSVIGLVEEYSTDPNQPLFILDGFESGLSQIYDLNMDRIASITILKDASATAIYGSKAANGVVVVETVKPKPGSLRVNYSGNFAVNFADLTDYNLMNSNEKLTFERLSGYYGSLDAEGNIISETQAQQYYDRLSEVRRGVDTYWMNEALRTGINQRHNLFTEGGDEKIRYGLGLSYGTTEGVMKNSNRETVNGNIQFIYRYKKLAFTNYFNVDFTEASNPSVSFSDFSRANPYFRKYDENGDILHILESFTNSQRETSHIYNPMYDFYLNSFDNQNELKFRNNFEVDYRMLEELRFRTRLSYAKGFEKGKNYRSPEANEFIGANANQRGRYTELNGNTNDIDFDISATYGKLVGMQHTINAVLGMRLNKNLRENSGYTATGFLDDRLSSPNFSSGFLEGSKPSYTFDDRRSLSYYMNASYSFDNRYLFDSNLRYDGASIFGSENKFSVTWALGLAWNIHNESFFEKLRSTVSFFKLRGSVGNPGNQNFDAYMTMNIFNYSNAYDNPFGLSALVDNWGNENLKWQKTLDFNYGMDLELKDRKFRITADYFHKTTNPLLIFVEVPSSTGQSVLPKNIGAQRTNGLTVSLNYRILNTNNLIWNANFNGRHLKEKYYNIGNSLDQLNENNKSLALQRFYDNGSPTGLWTVKSLGIDPTTGREVFEKKDGSSTFVYDFKDEVLVGNTTPTLEGVVGSSLYYKGFNASANFRYRVGGQIFLNTLYNKVENISSNSLFYNQDKRALYDRWKEPGDESKFKSISLTETTPISSRFVADENTFACESISLGYESNANWVKKMRLSSLTTRVFMNEIFRISTVKNERGIDYPFARTVSLSISARF